MNQTTNKTQTTGSSCAHTAYGTDGNFWSYYCNHGVHPFLGYPLGFTRATIIHIPVILASLLMGPKTELCWDCCLD